jgi:putative flippase GtrA
MQFVRYCIAGGIAAAAQFVVLAALVEFMAVEPLVASAIGFVIAVLINYVLQYRFTFEATDAHSSALPKFAAIACAGLLLNVCLFWLGNSAAGLPYLLAQVIATGCVVIFNFTLNRRFVFMAQST